MTVAGFIVVNKYKEIIIKDTRQSVIEATVQIPLTLHTTKYHPNISFRSRRGEMGKLE